jgi:hypothetical protein
MRNSGFFMRKKSYYRVQIPQQTTNPPEAEQHAFSGIAQLEYEL